MVSDHLLGGRSGVQDRSPPTNPSWTPSASTEAPFARRPDSESARTGVAGTPGTPALGGVMHPAPPPGLGV
eukprot:10585979-Alexandrium_andersonii.AAC.1